MQYRWTEQMLFLGSLDFIIHMFQVADRIHDFLVGKKWYTNSDYKNKIETLLFFIDNIKKSQLNYEERAK